MEMGKHLLKLVRLSKNDAKIFNFKNKKNEYNVLLKQCGQETEEINAQEKKDQEQLRELSLCLKKQEGDIKNCEDEIKKYNNSLSQIKKNDEYKMILNQIEKKQQDKSDKEELFLENLDKEESLKKSFLQGKEKAKDLFAKIEIRKKKILDHVKEVDRNIQNSIDHRAKLFQNVPKALKDVYLKILERRQDQALSMIQSDECCGACSMILMPEMVEKARSGKLLICCPTCSRILYHLDYFSRIVESGEKQQNNDQ